MRILIVAGEPSGDGMGAGLMHAMRGLADLPIHFFGVGGEAMLRERLEPVFVQSDLAVMGLAEVVPRLPRLLNRLRRLVDAVEEMRPHAVVTIDSSGFNRPLVRRLRKAGLAAPMVQYVAPMVWAWRPRRAAQVAAEFDHLLALFPFEPALFEKHGLATSWVGHPLTEAAAADRDASRRAAGIPSDALLLCVLPGSRRGEVERLLTPFGEAVAGVAAVLPHMRVVVPTLPHLAGLVSARIRAWPNAELVVGEEARRRAFAAADAALAASGTVTLELAAAGVPMVIGYRMNPLTAWMARRLLTVQHVALPNILLGSGLVPERLQEQCRPEMLADDLLRLLRDPDAAGVQRAGLATAVRRLRPEGGASPSERAAQTVLMLIERSLAAEEGRPQIETSSTQQRRHP